MRSLVDNGFGEWLAKILEEKGLSQADLARAMRRSRSAISQIISGKRGIGPSLAAAIADALKLPREEVYRAGGLLPPKITKNWLIDRIVEGMEDLPQEEKENVLEYIDMVRRMSEKRRKKK